VVFGVVTAWAGEGKTIAALVCQKEIESRKDVMEELGEQARGDNSSQLASDAALSIERNNLRLLIFDEADRLNDDSFEVVRYLLDKTGCPILLIGLPRLLQVMRSLLDNANILAKAKGEEKITLPLINDAYVRFMAQEEQYLYDNRSKTSSQGLLGSHEEISVKRHEAHGQEKKNT
jgi:DNA transposition AAA+ family ATPase